MAGSADFIQQAVHALEAGALAVWMRRALAVVVIIALALFYLLHEFRGLATSQAMDQAQIGRHIAQGHGWQTNLIRPRAIGQLQSNGKNVPQNIGYDTYNAPLPPLVNAVALLPARAYWKMTPKEFVYAGDRAIALVAVLLFVTSLIPLFFTARRLFDARLALLACGLVLICATIWEYSITGLPHMLLLLLFNSTLYCIVRAIQTRDDGGPTALWLAATGAGFGLLALSHALTIWMFAGALLVFPFVFQPRARSTLIVLGSFLIVYTPWLLRTWAVSGNPGGVAIYSIFEGVRHSEAGHMRRVALDLQDVGLGFFRNKITANLINQTGHLFQYLGWSVVAPMFFVSLLHPFKRTETALLRWVVLAMWVAAVLGMATYGVNEEQTVSANQLHLLFVPIMSCFGLAFLLVQWNRLEIDLSLGRAAFLTLLYLLCGLPMLFNLALAPAKGSIRWPPYVPPYISVLNDWMKPDEIVASDMPWAIAWYADRRGLWLPESVKAMTDMNDYNVAGAPVRGLYLTPISGSQNTLTDVLKGEHKEWAAVILRNVSVEKFPLKWATLLGFDNECVFFSDHDRQREHPK